MKVTHIILSFFCIPENNNLLLESVFIYVFLLLFLFSSYNYANEFGLLLLQANMNSPREILLFFSSVDSKAKLYFIPMNSYINGNNSLSSITHP